MSPSDLGQLIKPFVFLDHFHFDGQGPRMPMELGWHPHSGIATVTVVLEGAVRYAETTGKAGVLSAGSVEWMRAGNGVWHTGAAEPRGRAGIPAVGRAAARAGERTQREPLRDARGVARRRPGSRHPGLARRR